MEPLQNKIEICVPAPPPSRYLLTPNLRQISSDVLARQEWVC